MPDQSSRAKPLSKDKKTSDQRYLPRWEVKNRVVYRLNDEARPHEGQSKDLSCTGACIRTKDKLSPNQKVKLTIYLSDETAVQVEGQIVWNKPSQDHESLVGVMFVNTTQKTQDLILKHAFEIKKDELVKHWFSGWEKKS